MEQSVCFNFIQVSRDVLSDDFDGQSRLSVLIMGQKRLSLVVFLDVTHSLHLLLVDRDLSMDDLVQNVTDLELATVLIPLWRVYLLRVTLMDSARTSQILEQGHVHQLMNIWSFIDVDMEAILDERADRFVL